MCEEPKKERSSINACKDGRPNSRRAPSVIAAADKTEKIGRNGKGKGGGEQPKRP